MPGLFHTCPVCGSNLDPGEACDCQHEDPGLGAAQGQESEDALERGGADQ